MREAIGDHVDRKGQLLLVEIYSGTTRLEVELIRVDGCWENILGSM